MKMILCDIKNIIYIEKYICRILFFEIFFGYINRIIKPDCYKTSNISPRRLKRSILEVQIIM